MNKPMAGAFVSFYLLLTSFTQKSASFNRNDYVYDRGSRTFYKEHTTKVTWQQAVDTCASEGAQLAVPTIEAELNALIKYRSKNTNIWLGIHDLFGEGRFISLNGIPDTDLYTKWMDNEPNNLNDGEHCVILDANGGYNDVNCEYLVAFVCTGNVIYDPLYDQEGSSEPYFREDYVYNRAFQSFYKHHAVPLSWADAVTRCAAEGATLAAPLTADERDAILYHMMRGSASIWLGIHDHKSTGSFFTLDGTPVSNIFVDWAENEPNNGGDGEHCVQLYSTGFYNDNDCRQAYFFVCKKNITSLTTSNPMCETYDTEYKYNINSNRCYKYHATPSTWHEAYKTCYDEGSHLGMVNSALEAQVYLNTLINDSSSKEAQSENFKMQLIHLGFSKLLGAGVFKTIKGKTLDFSGYNEWASGQPKNAGTNARCGAMASLDGKLHAASCHLRKSFICEKNLHRPLSLDASLRYGTGDVHFCVNNP